MDAWQQGSKHGNARVIMQARPQDQHWEAAATKVWREGSGLRVACA